MQGKRKANFGILIYMYYNEHMPTHFQAKWVEYEAIILICTTHFWSGRHLPVMLSAAKHRVHRVRCFAALSMTSGDVAPGTSVGQQPDPSLRSG